MAKQTINVGLIANDRRGDPVRIAFQKSNGNFTELYDSVASISGTIATLSDVAFSGSYNDLLNIPPGGTGGTSDRLVNGNKQVILGANGTLTVPSPTSNPFVVTFSSANYVPTLGKPTLTLTGTPWALNGQYVYASDGRTEIMLDNIWPTLNNPGYTSGDTFTFNSTVHGIADFVLTIQLNNVVQAGPAGWTANVAESQPPVYASTIKSLGAVKVTASNSSWIFGTDGNLHYPDGSFSNTAFVGQATSAETLVNQGNATVTTGPTLGTQYIWDFGTDGTLKLPSGSPLLFGNGNSRIQAGMGFHINSEEGISLEAVDVTDPLNPISRGWYFDTNGNINLPSGSVISETASTISIAPPTAAAGQSLVVRPTAALWSVDSSGFISYGNPITISVTLSSFPYFGTINYEITGPGVTEQSLGRPTTGKLTFAGIPSIDTQTVTWTIPANSDITEFTFTITSVDGTRSNDIQIENDPALYYNFEFNALPVGYFVTVTNDNITNLEFSHVHLVAGDPATVDLYLGDDDQFVKIEKNGGNVVVGTNANTKNWAFDQNGWLTIPNNGVIQSDTLIALSSFNANDDIARVICQSFPNFARIDLKTITSTGAQKDWLFESTGNMTFPDLTVQTTAWAGGRVVSAPVSSIGTAGDKQGDLAFDGSHMYYCTQDYASETYSTTIVVTYSGFNPDIVKGSIPQPQAGWAFVHNGTTYTLASNAVENNPGEWNCELTTSISVTAGDTVAVGPVFASNIWKRIAWSVDTW